MALDDDDLDDDVDDDDDDVLEDFDLVLPGRGNGEDTEKFNRCVLKFSFQLPQIVAHILTNRTQRCQKQNHT